MGRVYLTSANKLAGTIWLPLALTEFFRQDKELETKNSKFVIGGLLSVDKFFSCRKMLSKNTNLSKTVSQKLQIGDKKIRI